MQIGFCGALGLLFIGLKLTNYIDWSWWLVLLPFYLGIAILLIAFLFTSFLIGFSLALQNIISNIKVTVKRKYK